MKNFIKMYDNVDISMLMHQLAHNENLWGQNKWRIKYEGSPHVDVTDIWLRYAKVVEDTKAMDVAHNTAPIWYSPITFLSQAKGLALDLMHKVEAYSLERMLITKIPPKGVITRHADNVGDYVFAGDIARYHIVLNGKEGSMFGAGDEWVCMKTGEVWWFNALAEHEVKNDSDEDRIHLIVDLKFMP